MPFNIAILASGSGSNAQAIFNAISAGHLDARVSLVLCNRPNAGVLEKAAHEKVPTLCLDHTTFPDRESFDAAMVQSLQEVSAELIVLAGYMRILTPLFIQSFAGRIINIHPALLPSFIGAHGAADALAWGVKMSGCTVHFVDEKVDNGPIIAQGAVPILPNDDAQSLQKRIQNVEHKLYPQVIQWFAEERISVDNRQVVLAPPQRHKKCEITTQQSSEKKRAETQPCLIWPPLEGDFIL